MRTRNCVSNLWALVMMRPHKSCYIFHRGTHHNHRGTHGKPKMRNSEAAMHVSFIHKFHVSALKHLNRLFRNPKTSSWTGREWSAASSAKSRFGRKGRGCSVSDVDVACVCVYMCTTGRRADRRIDGHADGQTEIRNYVRTHTSSSQRVENHLHTCIHCH